LSLYQQKQTASARLSSHLVDFKQKGPAIIYCDNSSTIKLSKNPILYGSKHIDVQYHLLRDWACNEEFDLVYCRREDQIADIFTKVLKLAAFQKLRQMLGVSKTESSWFKADIRN